MPRGKQLTDKEIGQIIAFKAIQLSNRSIATKLGRSEKIIRTYLKQEANKQPRNRGGRPPKLKVRDVRRIFRLATVSQMSSKKIAALLVSEAKKFNSASTFSLHYTTVLKVLRASKFAKYIKRKKCPKLTTLHKKKRVEFAVRNLNRFAELKLTIFSDEKKFNLDGPDGCQFYWHDLRKERERFSCNVAGGGSVMIWGGFSYYGKTELAFLEGKQNSSKYVETLKQYLVSAIADLKRQSGSSMVIFQQDNASIHTSQETTDYLKMLDAEVSKWPAKSPDLNPIENVWGVLARSVYANGRQFISREQLKSQIEQSWREIGSNYLKGLIDGMPTRMAQVILQRGNTIDK